MNTNNESGILFLKIFRNKVLFKEITSNFHSNKYHKYEDINEVGWMLEYGYQGLLIDKLKKGVKTLSFKTPSIKTGLATNYYPEIFKNINKDTQEHYQFYQSLFSNYQNYIDPKSIYALVEVILNIGCLVAVKVLVNHFNYKPTIKNIFNSYVSSSVKSMKLIIQLQTQPPPLNFLNMPQFILSDTSELENDQDKFKLLNYLYKSHYNLINNKSVTVSCVRKLYKFDPFELTVNQLIQSNILINNLQFHGKNSIIVKQLLSINQLDEIENKFTKQQLKMKPIDLINYFKNEYSNTKQYNSISNYIQLLIENYLKVKEEYQYTAQPCLDYYFNFIDCDYELINTHLYKSGTNEFNLIKALKYGNYQYLIATSFIQSSNGENVKSIWDIQNNKFKEILSNNEYTDILFSNCPNDNESHIQFIKEMVKFINHCSNNNNQGNKNQLTTINPMLLLFLVIEFDQINLVELILETYHFMELTKDCKNELKIGIHRFIKSEKMLEFIHGNEYFNHLINNESYSNNESFTYWYLFGKLELIELYIKLEMKKRNTTTTTTETTTTTTIELPIFETSIFQTLSQDFLKQCNNVLDTICQTIIQPVKFENVLNRGQLSTILSTTGNVNKSLTKVKFILSNTKNPIHPNFIYRDGTIQLNRLLKYLIESGDIDYKSRCRIPKHSFIYIDKLDLLYGNNLFDDYGIACDLSPIIGKKDDMVVFKIVISRQIETGNLTDLQFKIFLQRVLFSSIESGSTKSVLKYILENYYDIVTTPNTGQTVSDKELEIYNASIGTCHHYLINYINDLFGSDKISKITQSKK